MNRINNFYEFLNENIMWTEKELQDEADKYESRVEFQSKNKSAYSAACNRVLLDKLFKNHTNKGYVRRKM